ncbi:PQQ-dependent sugar dehydrogenase [Candidatus Sumerlaeota bacterium]|nr:PQQ-dependent sugar dehydrogenase [Candidatus Sumerlaeota bacterium]
MSALRLMAVAAVLACSLGVGAQPPLVTLEPVASGFDNPLFVTHAGDGSGRLFVVERGGKIRVVLPGGGVQSTPFLDIGPSGLNLISTQGYTQGLLGLAFHPDFAQSGRLFLHASDRETGGVMILEFIVSPPSAPVVQATPTVILGPLPQLDFDHSGGTVAFGPNDGMLCISLGDGGGQGDPHGNGQNLSTPQGSILRIDVDHPTPPLAYGIPVDNPHVGEAGASPEIFAHGFRNPYRFSFDRGGDHRLFVGDVGQRRIEEIDIVIAGGNYGWSIREGSECFNPANFESPLPTCDSVGLTSPIHEYLRPPTEPFAAVTGGVVYRGSRSAQLWGMYVFGDFQTGEIWALQELGTGDWICHDLMDTSLFISSFGEDEEGEIYLTDFFGGELLRVAPEPMQVMVNGSVLR